jgi:mono/diheme cytochrome c family protein
MISQECANRLVVSCTIFQLIAASGCATGAPLDGDSETGDTGDAGSSTTVEPERPDAPAPLPEEARSVFEEYCADCHGPDSPGSANIRYITDLSELVDNKLVVAGDAEASPVYRRMTDASNPMPPLGVAKRPSAGDIEVVRRWIAAGALPGEQACDNPFIGFDDMIEDMRLDLFKNVNSADRVHVRYLTLTHLHNAGMCDRELELYRAAVAKGVNSLSLRPKLVRPEAIDTFGTILRVDLRDYGWDENPNFIDLDLWDTIAAANPFAVAFERGPAEDLRALAGTDTPFQPADSFLQIATGGVMPGVEPGQDFYYKILQLPHAGAPDDSVDALERLPFIGLADRAAAIAAGDVFRVIVQDSGVSQNNRAFDRYDGSSFGSYYYRSFDFAGEDGARNLFNHPTDFIPDGGEMIFTLPNGLQGYAISDAGDELISEAPTNVVKDLGQRDAVVRVGISCMDCHASGIITTEDEFYAFYNAVENNFEAGERDLIDKLFADPAGAFVQQRSDAQQFQARLAQLGITAPTPEPISGMSRQFEANLSLDRVAAEVGMTARDFSFELGGLDGSFDKLRFGSMTRDEFAVLYQESLCVLLPGEDVVPIACNRLGPE